ncbi:hypothetical protein O181_091474 [Austropuccinia psidii MF-1]|uniref:Reverse transcriptase/retrotransposon-derived protein RNase H-like domain-containing protein n=1 Tax=Austropuccinia psidii MF-1 TaxID=1389203 RepID=A0A9Q3IXF3_9BASI|nr:hypothetical protein [Austropuccinia psidii MF-1]
MNQAKVQQILNWTPPRNLKALQSFLGFANFYSHFIKNYSKKMSSITSLLKKHSCFPLNEEALRHFHQLKEAFTLAPILSHFNPSLPTIVETDASYYALGAVLSQISDSGKHPIAFDSRKLLPAELNHEIHDKQLFGIVWALKRCRAFLLSLSSSFEVSPIIPNFNISFHQRFSLSIKPAGVNFSPNSIIQSLTTLAAWPPFQMHCHSGMTFTQRRGKISSGGIQ